MTVYVDDWRQAAKAGRLNARWSHLTVGPFDDPEELHAFAARIGLRRSWFQDKPWPRAHYDVTESKRQQAIRAGAVPITWREIGRQMAGAIAAQRREPATTAHTPEPAPASERAPGNSRDHRTRTGRTGVGA